MPPPVRRFEPVPGIVVDIAGSSIGISGRMQAWGPEANAARAAEIQSTINRVWTQRFEDGFNVSCAVSVTYRATSSPAANVLQIEIANMAGPSVVNTPLIFGARTMQLNARSPDVFTWVAAHEFGHVLGMADRYSETTMSSLCNRFGCERNTTVERGYERNLMGAHLGGMSSQNLRDLASETAPSPWWINDDDEVRAWVTAHSLAQIGALPAAHKIEAIRTLMAYWISDEDLAAIVKICHAVRTVEHARAIRAAIDPLSFTDLGQRTRFRLALAAMPS